MSQWTPLKNRIFAALWVATIVSNLGTWMHGVGAQWLMTDLSSSSVAVALLQSAGAAPVFLLSLHAGALADVVDRRRLLIVAQSWMVLVAGALAALSWQDAMTPVLLLALTTALAVGSALNGPAWSAIVPDLVPREQLPDALVINGIAFTATMAVGPALGGVVVAGAGPGAVFALNAVSFLATIAVLARWRPAVAERALPPEHVGAAVRAGARYLRHAPAMWPVLARVVMHVSCMSATMALLPLLAREELEVGAGSFGLLMGATGVGSAAGAFIVPRVRNRFGVDATVSVAAVAAGAGMVALAATGALVVAVAVLAATGLATMAAMSSFNLAMQRVLPGWVRGRGLAIYLLAFQAAVAVGAFAWGAVAESVGVRTAIAAGGALLAVTGLAPVVLRQLRLASAVAADTATGRWPDPHITVQPEPDDGPILVTVAYTVRDEDAEQFLAAMHRLRTVRRRDGALRWRVYRDLAAPSTYVETYLVESWGEHLRQRSRSTPADRDTWFAARQLHSGDEPPVATFHVAARAGQRLVPVEVDDDVGVADAASSER